MEETAPDPVPALAQPPPLLKVTTRPANASTLDQGDAADADGRERAARLLREQLEREMLKRRPDHFVLGVTCRSLGGVPPELRARVWQELLGVARSERLFLDQSILRVEEDLENQRVISADACRTRGKDPLFKQQETVELVAKILTYYCKCRNIRYKQGMNEVLAPFLLLERDPPLPESVVFQLFYAMIDKFLPHVFADREFKSLQCSFQLYRLLMLYHDPELAQYLDQHDMIPELYVTPWFMTLFARNLSAELVFCLWDFFLLEEDPFLLHFVAYALVAANRRHILEADIATLPQVLSRLTFSSREELERICVEALALSETTPRSFKRDLYAVCYGGFSNETLPFLQHLYAASSLQVYPEELVRNLMNRITNKKNSPHKMRMAMAQSSNADGDDTSLNPLLSPSSRQSSFSYEREASSSSVFFIVLDCRPLEQYQECHLSLSYHIDPEIVASPDALAVLMKGFARMKGCHFCFVGPSDPSWSAPRSTSNGNIAITTIARLARGISGDRATPSVTSPPTAATTSSATTLLDNFTTEPPVLKASTSNGEPGSLENEIASIGSSGDGSRPRWHEEHVSVTRLVLMFLQKGFEHISRLNGGFDQLKQEILRMDAFAQEQLLVFAPPPTAIASGSSGAFKLFAKIGLGSRSRAPSSDEANFSEGSGATTDSSVETASATTASTSTTIKLKAPKSIASSSFSQRLLSLKAAAKDAVSNASSSSALNRSTANNDDQRGEDDSISEHRLVGEEEWLEVCIKTREALEKSLQYKEVVFQAGSLGILFQKSRTSKKFQTVVDSIVPDSQASESQQIVPGDLLVGVNGQSLADIPFLSVIEMVKDASRPLVLRLQSPKRKKSMDAFDAISIPPAAPTLVSATPHSVCVTWTKLPLPNSRYQLQYAYQSEFHFNPWVPAVMKRQGSSSAAELGTSGITEHTNGTMVGLDPGQSLVFRVRCGNGDKWGPYSVSSSAMTTLEKEDAPSFSGAADTPQSSPSSVEETREPRQGPVFLPGVCPSIVEHGEFFFRVLLSLRARKRPEFDAEKLGIVFEKGFVIQCDKRIVAPGTNQIFVRLAGSGVSRANNDAAIGGIVGGEVDDEGVWAFENTLDGALVLERVAGDAALGESPTKTSLAIQEQAKSVVSSLLSASGIKSTAAASSGGSSSSSPNTTSSTTSAASPNVVSAPVTVMLVPPRILQVFPASETEIVVTWDPINEVGVTKYQIQYSKDRLASMWWTVKQDIDADMLKFTVTELLPNTPYLFRVRGGSDEYGWGPYSEPSASCRTSPLAVAAPDSDRSRETSEGDSVADDSATEAAAATAPPALGSSGSRGKTRPSVPSIFSSSNNGSSNSLRTGSTILDKAVAVAARLTSSRRRSLSSNSVDTASSSAVTCYSKGDDTGDAGDESSGYSENSVDDLTIIPQYVNLAKWKESSGGACKDFRFYHAAKYEPRRSKSVEQKRGDNNEEGAGSTASGCEYHEQDLERVGERELVLTPGALLLLNSWASSREEISLVEENRPLSSIQRVASISGLNNSVVFEFTVSGQ